MVFGPSLAWRRALRRRKVAIFAFLKFHRGTCKKSCITLGINGNLNIDVRNSSQKSFEKLFFYFIVAPGKMKVSEEYLIHDFIGVIASIGGTLGLFIGFSFTNISSFLFNLMKDNENHDPAKEKELSEIVEHNKEAIRKMLIDIGEIQRRIGAYDISSEVVK